MSALPLPVRKLESPVGAEKLVEQKTCANIKTSVAEEIKNRSWNGAAFSGGSIDQEITITNGSCFGSRACYSAPAFAFGGIVAQSKDASCDG